MGNPVRMNSPGRGIGTNDSAKDIGPVRWPAAAECLTL